MVISRTNTILLGRVLQGMPPTAPLDASLPNSSLSMWMDEDTDEVRAVVKYADGTVMRGVVMTVAEQFP